MGCKRAAYSLSRHHTHLNARRWAAVRRTLFERDGWRCVMCGKAGRLECDHVTPLEREPGACLSSRKLTAKPYKFDDGRSHGWAEVKVEGVVKYRFRATVLHSVSPDNRAHRPGKDTHARDLGGAIGPSAQLPANKHQQAKK